MLIGIHTFLQGEERATELKRIHMGRRGNKQQRDKTNRNTIEDNSSDAGGSLESASSYARSAKEDFDDDVTHPTASVTPEEELDEAIEDLTERR